MFVLFKENRLEEAERELQSADLNQRLESLVDLKTIHNKWIENYNSEILLLDSEVANIKSIADSLPNGCFKKTRLEP